MTKPAVFPTTSSVVAMVALAVAGCGTGGGPRDLMLEEARASQSVERPVAMKGESSFLEGKVAVVATVTRGFDRGVRREGGGRGGRGGPNADGGEGGRRGRHGDDVGAFSEVYNISGGDSEEEQKEAMAEYIRQAMARRAAGSPMPPVTLRVQFENRGTEPVELEVTEVNSDLGNFAVRPPKLTIPPGEKGVLEPMVSQLGVTNDEIPLKLALRVAGRKEAQTILVKSVITPAQRKEFEAMQK